MINAFLKQQFLVKTVFNIFHFTFYLTWPLLTRAITTNFFSHLLLYTTLMGSLSVFSQTVIWLLAIMSETLSRTNKLKQIKLIKKSLKNISIEQLIAMFWDYFSLEKGGQVKYTRSWVSFCIIEVAYDFLTKSQLIWWRGQRIKSRTQLGWVLGIIESIKYSRFSFS